MAEFRPARREPCRGKSKSSITFKSDGALGRKVVLGLFLFIMNQTGLLHLLTVFLSYLGALFFIELAIFVGVVLVQHFFLNCFLFVGQFMLFLVLSCVESKGDRASQACEGY